MLTPANARDMARVPVGVLQARGAVREFRPDVVLATGGYIAIPVGLAAPSPVHAVGTAAFGDAPGARVAGASPPDAAVNAASGVMAPAVHSL
jgi:hypothetical protein